MSAFNFFLFLWLIYAINSVDNISLPMKWAKLKIWQGTLYYFTVSWFRLGSSLTSWVNQGWVKERITVSKSLRISRHSQEPRLHSRLKEVPYRSKPVLPQSYARLFINSLLQVNKKEDSRFETCIKSKYTKKRVRSFSRLNNTLNSTLNSILNLRNRNLDHLRN